MLRRGRCGLVIFHTELDAKIVLARRMWMDRGEKRTFRCPKCGGGIWHLTAEDDRIETDDRIPPEVDLGSLRPIASIDHLTEGAA